MRLYKITGTVRAFKKNSMWLPKTTLGANLRPITQVSIKCSIYGGDDLSSLFYWICLNPLSQIFTKSGFKYQFRNGTMISHLLYMYSIKL